MLSHSYFDLFRFADEILETVNLGDSFITILTRHDSQCLRVLIGNPENCDTIRIKCHRLGNFDGNRRILNIRRFRMNHQIVTGLLISLTGEAGIIGNILKRTANGIGAYDDVALQIVNRFAEQVLAGSDISIYR